MRLDEMLTDIADDLHDYEKDVGKNSFNVLRGAVHALGDGAPLALADHIGRCEKEHEALLQRLPQGQRDAYCSARAEAMARRPGADKWSFPARLMRPEAEQAFRAELSSDEGEGDDMDDDEARERPA